MECSDWILAGATVLGPFSAVLLTLFIQRRWEKIRRREAEDWEMKRVNASGRYTDEWNQAFRDKFERLVDAVEKIASNKGSPA